MIEYVDAEMAREARGVRIVVPGTVPSPWSEATKAVFRLAGVPVLAVRFVFGSKDLVAWTGVDNVPVVFHGREPPRTCWSSIVGLAARIGERRVLPADPAARADAVGVLDLIAGEDGIGWNGRLAMIHAGLTTNGEKGLAPAVAGYLAKRYGYTPALGSGVRDRVAAQAAWLAARLGDREYLGGDAPSALDAYAATFLTVLLPIGETDCPKMPAPQREAFGAAAELLHDVVPPPLFALRARMFERHLPWPIEL
jgi:glutathione S-transferase